MDSDRDSAARLTLKMAAPPTTTSELDLEPWRRQVDTDAAPDPGVPLWVRSLVERAAAPEQPQAQAASTVRARHAAD